MKDDTKSNDAFLVCISDAVNNDSSDILGRKNNGKDHKPVFADDKKMVSVPIKKNGKSNGKTDGKTNGKNNNSKNDDKPLFNKQ